MPRIARVVVAGVPHHVTQRGNNKQHVFDEDLDRWVFMRWLKECGQEFGLLIWAYCLMSDHVHLVVVPAQPDSMAQAFEWLFTRYAQRLNRNRGASGHIWQGRYFSCPMDSVYLYNAIRYVERNPIRCRACSTPEGYPWSSAWSHVYRRTSEFLSGEGPLDGAVDDWRAYLDDDSGRDVEDEIRLATRTGRPLGSKEFTERIERELSRTLVAQRVGRPSRDGA